MNEVQSAPRIDVSQLGEWQDQVVRIVGRVEQGQSPVAVLGCGESGQIHVQVKMSPGNLYNSTYVEVIGRVVSDGIEEYGSFDLGDNFDLANYQQALNFANGQYMNLFR